MGKYKAITIAMTVMRAPHEDTPGTPSAAQPLLFALCGPAPAQILFRQNVDTAEVN